MKHKGGDVIDYFSSWQLLKESNNGGENCVEDKWNESAALFVVTAYSVALPKLLISKNTILL